MLKELYKNPLSITDLSTKLDIPISTVQYHINKLIELGVIK
ncbi:TPA: ArsR family transcriptional regulator, partial [Candidatus Geothermarchaeota archaeon]|nr:ArsR family transcriptional regulator [Candidatus Geothermarchaeota archaeon]